MANISLNHIKLIIKSAIASATRYKPNLEVTDPDDPRYVAGKLPKEKLPNLGLAKVAKTGNYNDLINKPNFIETINGIFPDSNGDVEIDSGGVKTVNGVGPDESGNVDSTIIQCDDKAYTIYLAKQGQYVSNGYGLFIYNNSIEQSHIDAVSLKAGGLSYNSSKGLNIDSTINMQPNKGSSTPPIIELTKTLTGNRSTLTLDGEGHIYSYDNKIYFGPLSTKPNVLKWVGAPIDDTDAVNKKYVDAKVSDTELILGSSTASSNKRFKITVDDSGTISATEVTE